MLRNDGGRPGRRIDTRFFGSSLERGGCSQTSWLRRGELNETLFLKGGDSRTGRV